MLMPRQWTGQQLLYEKATGRPLELSPEGGRCRLCGGQLTRARIPSSAVSSSWTDEANCQAKDSIELCEACQWFTKSHGYRNLWEGQHVVVADQEGIKHLFYDELLPYLKQGSIAYPLVAMLKGTSPTAFKKHTEIRANHAVSYCDENFRVAFCYLSIFDRAPLDGVAAFSRGQFTDLVEELSNLGREYILPRFGKQKPYTQRNIVFERLWEKLSAQGGASPASYLACFLASWDAVPEPAEDRARRLKMLADRATKKKEGVA